MNMSTLANAKDFAASFALAGCGICSFCRETRPARASTTPTSAFLKAGAGPPMFYAARHHAGWYTCLSPGASEVWHEWAGVSRHSIAATRWLYPTRHYSTPTMATLIQWLAGRWRCCLPPLYVHYHWRG